MKSVIAEDLVKTYDKGNVKALDHLSLDVEEGTVLSVLGPNGAGKTTTVRILSTLLRPDSGRATVAGIDVIKHHFSLPLNYQKPKGEQIAIFA